MSERVAWVLVVASMIVLLATVWAWAAAQWGSGG